MKFEEKNGSFLCEISCYCWPLLALHFSRTSPQTIQNVLRTANAIWLQLIPVYLGSWGAPLVLFQSADYINGPVLLLNELGLRWLCKEGSQPAMHAAFSYHASLWWWFKVAMTKTICLHQVKSNVTAHVLLCIYFAWRSRLIKAAI